MSCHVFIKCFVVYIMPSSAWFLWLANNECESEFNTVSFHSTADAVYMISVNVQPDRGFAAVWDKPQYVAVSCQMYLLSLVLLYGMIVGWGNAPAVRSREDCELGLPAGLGFASPIQLGCCPAIAFRDWGRIMARPSHCSTLTLTDDPFFPMEKAHHVTPFLAICLESAVGRGQGSSHDRCTSAVVSEAWTLVWRWVATWAKVQC